MLNLENIKKYISTHRITFLIDFDKRINIDKSGRAYYDKQFNIDLDQIRNFIYNLEDNENYLVNPFICINCRLNKPYLTLSRQFLISNKSNSVLIYNYLINQMVESDFEINDENYYLVFKYYRVVLDERIIGK